MKSKTVLCQIALVGLIGCSEPIEPTATSEPGAASVGQTTTETSTATTFVSLKVPNMT